MTIKDELGGVIFTAIGITFAMGGIYEIARTIFKEKSQENNMMTKEERFAAAEWEYRNNPIYKRFLTPEQIEQHIEVERKWILGEPKTTITQPQHHGAYKRDENRQR